MWQYIAIIVILMLALFFVIKKFLGSWQAVKQGQSGCPGCDKCEQVQSSVELQDHRE